VAIIIPFLQDEAFDSEVLQGDAFDPELLQGEVYDPEALRAMSTALANVCRLLKVEHDQDACEVMAIRIIDLARRGERDPERLRDRVLWEAGATSSLADRREDGCSPELTEDPNLVGLGTST
jgi:hypothetical protein